jgi:hypothetical protein
MLFLVKRKVRKFRERNVAGGIVDLDFCRWLSGSSQPRRDHPWRRKNDVAFRMKLEEEAPEHNVR